MTSYCPGDAYECDGFRWVELAPSPKSHCRVATEPSSSVLRSVKLQRRSSQSMSNSALGASLDGGAAGDVAVTSWEDTSVAPPSSVTVRVTV